MRIQLITKNRNLKNTNEVFVSDVSSPFSPDDFDVNVIDLSCKDLWVSNSSMAGTLNAKKDLCSLFCMIADSKRTKIVYVYPQDGIYKFNYSYEQYRSRKRIKDLITNRSLTQDFMECFPSPYESIIDVMYEPTKTCLGDVEYLGDFHFCQAYGEIISCSKISSKITTLSIDDKYFFTTLNVCDSIESILQFISSLFNADANDLPDWVKEFVFCNDLELKTTIENDNHAIGKLQERIDDAESQLDTNNRYKSILVSNGDYLVEVVFEILEKLLNCDLSSFVDVNKEDFLIELDEHVFIGEIKGITSNVKNEHISQLDVHYQSYIDEIGDENCEKRVHSILIINPLRNKEINEREPVNQKQIDLAVRNKSLIIETVILLKLFELFQKGMVSSARIRSVFAECTGLLRIEDVFEVDWDL